MMALDMPKVVTIRPFLKWVGGKRQLLPELQKHVPETFGHYFEPFVGGGALFFGLRARGWKGRATLNDSNELLVRSYVGVRDSVEALIEEMRPMKYAKAEYLKRRAAMPDASNSPVYTAAWVIYMNRCGFNGLWRVNKKGQFNVPFGKYTNPTICDAEGLRAASKALDRARLMIGDFEKTVRTAEKGDLVYFDPPYMPASDTADFTAYTADGFEYADQKRLRDCARLLKLRGVRVILSNADVPGVHDLYKSFKITRVEARRNINSKGDKRGPVGEVIIT